MEFARKQLEKYGWTDGKGLGKDENGNPEPVKAKIKHSLTGVGYNPSADFTEHWWTTLYDKAAGNLEVENKNCKVKKIKRKNDGEFEVTNSMWKLKRRGKPKKNQSSEEEYSEFFVKTAVISGGGDGTTRLCSSDSESDEEEVDSKINMSDEELFTLCGGRTAHKGARHGLRALGKLARIEQQEQALLQHVKYKGYSHHEVIKNKCAKKLQLVENTNLHNNGETNTIIQKKKQCNNTDNIGKIPMLDNSQSGDSVAVDKNEIPIGRKLRNKINASNTCLETTGKKITSKKKRKHKS